MKRPKKLRITKSPVWSNELKIVFYIYGVGWTTFPLENYPELNGKAVNVVIEIPREGAQKS